MTNFNANDFSYHGGYLTYHGEQGRAGVYYFSNMKGGCHPTRHGTARELFIARFKYGKKNWRTWVTFICKNFTVEEWSDLANHEDMTPVAIMQSKGFTRL